MTTYIPASAVVAVNYPQFKQHLKAYNGELINFNDYKSDTEKLCRRWPNMMDDEIKTIIIDMFIVNSLGSVLLNDVLGYKHVPTDEQLVKIRFKSTIWDTWPYFTYTALKCIIKSGYKNFVSTDILKIQWNDQCIELVCDHPLDLIKKILSISKLTLSSATLIAAYRAHNTELIEYHNMPITDECILAASQKGTNDSFVLSLVDKLPLTYNTLSLMIQIKQCTPKRVLNIMQHLPPTQEHVKLACTHHRVDLIQLLLNYRLTVDAECFELMFFTNNKSGKLIDAKIVESLVEQFIIAGYQLTYEDIIRLARRKYYVRDIQRFNFTFDNELINVCILNDELPPYDLPYTIESLRFACLTSSSVFVTKIIDSGIIPDKQCMINAIMIEKNSIDKGDNNFNIIKLLMKYVTLDEELGGYLFQADIYTSLLKY